MNAFPARRKACLFSTLAALGLVPCLAAESGTQVFELATATVADVNAAYDAGVLSAERLVELLMARIEAYDQAGPGINAVIAVHPEALSIARELDQERRRDGPRSPIHGIPVLLKDNFDTYDMPTTGASKALEGSMAPDDAFTVARLRDAGAIVLAKVNLSELARSGVSISSLMGQTYNPYDLTRTPGGSSGGTGAAIAATFGILGTGSDTGQSTRSPASANNLVGIRPTFGLISRDGIIPISYTQDTAGPITRYVADAAVMMDYLVGFDPQDPSTWAGIGKAPSTYTDFLDEKALKGARIAYVPDLFGDGSHPEHEIVSDITLRAIDAMRAAGATVFPVDIPLVSEYVKGTRSISVSGFESVRAMNGYFTSLGPDAIIKNMHEFVATGLTFRPILERLKAELDLDHSMSDLEYRQRLENQAAFRDSLVAVMDEYALDALFYPHQRRLVVPATAEPEQVERNGFMASSTGLPAITVPGGFSPPSDDAPIGVPIGVEFLGRPFSEGELIGFAYAFEQATRHRRVPLSTPALPGETINY